MTNKQWQVECNVAKWLSSQASGVDMSGQMQFCKDCPYVIESKCSLIDDEKTRTEQCICGKNAKKLKIRW